MRSSITVTLIIKTIGDSLNIDGNEIQAYDGTSISELHLQNEGGEVRIGGNNSSDLVVNGNISINNNGNWYIGSSNTCSDIIIDGTNATIHANNSNLNLSAGPQEIVAQSHLMLDSTQAGKATIDAYATEVIISNVSVSQNAIIIVTPCQTTYYPPAVVINGNGTFSIAIPDAFSTPTTYNYVIFRK